MNIEDVRRVARDYDLREDTLVSVALRICQLRETPPSPWIDDRGLLRDLSKDELPRMTRGIVEALDAMAQARKSAARAGRILARLLEDQRPQAVFPILLVRLPHTTGGEEDRLEKIPRLLNTWCEELEWGEKRLTMVSESRARIRSRCPRSPLWVSEAVFILRRVWELSGQRASNSKSGRPSKFQRFLSELLPLAGATQRDIDNALREPREPREIRS